MKVTISGGLPRDLDAFFLHSLVEQANQGKYRIHRRGRRTGLFAQFNDYSQHAIDLERFTNFEILQHRSLVLAHALGTFDASLQRDAKTGAEFFGDLLCFGHHLRGQPTGLRNRANIDQRGLR